MGRLTQIFLIGLTLLSFTLLFTACGGEGGTEVGNPPAQQAPQNGMAPPPPSPGAIQEECPPEEDSQADTQNCDQNDDSMDETDDNPDDIDNGEAPEENETELSQEY